LWFLAREWLASRDHKLPTCEGGCARDCLHETLAEELVAPRFDYTSSGKLLVESKSDMKNRGIKSPNVADAMMLTFASGAAGMIHGSRGAVGGYRWHEPIRRGRSMV
jgi:hypothetical protein